MKKTFCVDDIGEGPYRPSVFLVPLFCPVIFGRSPVKVMACPGSLAQLDESMPVSTEQRKQGNIKFDKLKETLQDGEEKKTNSDPKTSTPNFQKWAAWFQSR